jgi:hypothetical protein
VQTAKDPATSSNCLTCKAHAEGKRGPCYLHSPKRAEERRRNTSRAAKSKGNAELKKLKAEIREVIAEIKDGARDRNDATAIFQGYRVLKDLIELERRIKETDELEARLRELEHIYEQRNGVRRYG